MLPHTRLAHARLEFRADALEYRVRESMRCLLVSLFYGGGVGWLKWASTSCSEDRFSE